MKSLPAWAERLLRAICPEELYEQIEGDLIEIYNYEVKIAGKRKAKLRLILASLKFFRPGIVLRNKINIEHNQFRMYKNYFVTSIRHIRKSKMNFAFKLAGLSLAIYRFLSPAIYVS
jgi:putative ABC transport system permease protein